MDPACAFPSAARRNPRTAARQSGRRAQGRAEAPGRRAVALSPFKAEKTPRSSSTTRSFYHCFASGEHGDIFTFVMKTDGVSFPEAVERLAQEAGVPLPAPEARQPEREDERQRLYALLEAAAQFFEEQLKAADGAEAAATCRSAPSIARPSHASGSAMRPVPGRRCARPWRARATARRT